MLSSNFSINADLDGGTAREIDVSSGAVFYGRLERSVAADSRGSASILGLGSAFTLFSKAPVTDYDAGKVRVGLDNLHLEEPRDFRDKYAIMHLFGPVYEGYWRGSTATVAWGLEAYPDFGLVNAYALNAYSVDHEVAGTKTTMLYSGYYYGYGGSAMARLEASAGPVTFGAAASLHYHESIEGLDRFEDDLTARRARLGHLVQDRRPSRGVHTRHPLHRGGVGTVDEPPRHRRRHGREGDGVAVFPRRHLAPVIAPAQMGPFSGLLTAAEADEVPEAEGVQDERLGEQQVDEDVQPARHGEDQHQPVEHGPRFAGVAALR